MLAILTTTATAFTVGAPARGVSGRVQRHAAVTSLDFLKQCETSLRCALRLRGGGACACSCFAPHTRSRAAYPRAHAPRLTPQPYAALVEASAHCTPHAARPTPHAPRS